MARKSVEVGFGILAAHSVGYIFEGRGCAPLTWGSPIPQYINTPEMQKPAEAGFLTARMRRDVAVSNDTISTFFKPHECGEISYYITQTEGASASTYSS